MFRNDIRTIIEGLDKSFEREYAKFDEYSDIKGLNELKELIISLRNNDILVEFDDDAHYLVDEKNFEHEKKGYKSNVTNEFFVMANKKLSPSKFPIYFQSIQGFVTATTVEAFLMLINFNYFHYSKKKISIIKSAELVFGGDIIQYFSFFTDDFKELSDLPDYDETFFKNLKNMKFENKRARLLEDFIRCGYLGLIIVEQNISLELDNLNL